MATTPSPTLNALSAKYAEYEAHCRKLGIKFNNLHVADLPAPYGRGVVAAAPIAPKTKIVEVPIATCFNTNSIDNGINGFIGLARSVGVNLNEDDKLALQLIKERYVLKQASRFAKHIAALPEAVDVPFYFTEEEMSSFKGTNLHKLAEQVKTQTEALHQQILNLLNLSGAGDKAGLPASAFTLDAYKWAMSMVSSRFVSLHAGERGSTLKTMVPFFDMFNHSPVANVAHSYDPRTRCVVITSEQGWDAGQQVFLNYGTLPSLRALWLHGFLVPNPDYESYTLELMIPKTTPGFEKRVRLIRDHGGLINQPQMLHVAEAIRQAMAKVREDNKKASGDSSEKAEEGKAESSSAEEKKADGPVSSAFDLDDVSALDLPSPTLAASAAGGGLEIKEDWKGHVGALVPAADGSGLGLSALMFRDHAHYSLFRALRILHTPTEELAALESALRHDKDCAHDIEVEAQMLKSLGESLSNMIREIPELTQEEGKRLGALFATQREGAAAMRQVTAAIQAELVAADPGTQVRSPRPVVKAGASSSGAAGGAGADDGEEEETFNVLIGGGGAANSKKKQSGANNKKGNSKTGNAKAPAKPAASASSEAAAAPAPAAPVAPAADVSKLLSSPAFPSSHEYRMQCGAYVRQTEKQILMSQMRLMTDDLEALKAIVAQHNVENSKLRGGHVDNAAPAADAPAAAPAE